MAMKIVVLEDNLDRQRAMRECLADRFPMYEQHFFATAADMIRFLEQSLEETLVIALDHDLELQPGPNGSWIDPGTGRDVADFLTRREPVCPVIIHTTNTPAAAGMELTLSDAGWRTARVIPFDDLTWIATDWFRAMRRGIVGPIQGESTPALPITPARAT